MVAFIWQKEAQGVVKREISQLSYIVVRGQKLDKLPPKKSTKLKSPRFEKYYTGKIPQKKKNKQILQDV